MAQVFLPCESQQWPEDKKYFTSLSKINSAEEFDKFVRENSETGVLEEDVVSTSQRIASLQGLSYFFSHVASQNEKDLFFSQTLPFICRSASCLDVLVPEQGVPFLKQQEGASLVLGRKLVLSLIANAFLCTFPKDHPLGKKAESFNFDKFFKRLNSGDKSSRVSSQAAKLKCFLNYFNRCSYREEDGVPGTITYTRQIMGPDEIPSLSDWMSCDYPLCNVTVDNEGKIEDAGSRSLQVDFAAAHIGGGVLRGGKVQEEIRFCICPELIVSMLINDSMEDNEAILVTGYERFSYYTGYAESFKYAGDYEDMSERDVYGNLNTALTAIDATRYTEGNGEEQYHEDNVLRDLNKALVGFLSKNEQGDISLQSIPMRQAEYGPDDFSIADMNSLCETSSQTEDEIGVGVDFDSYYTSLSSDIISQAVNDGRKYDSQNNEDNSGEDQTSREEEGYRLTANSLVKSVIQDVMNSQDTVGRVSEPVIDGFAKGLADSIISSIGKVAPATTSSDKSTTSMTTSTQENPVHTHPSSYNEYTESLVNDAISEGINQVLKKSTMHEEDGRASSSRVPSVPLLQVSVEDTEKSPSNQSTNTSSSNSYADKLASNILGSVLVPVSPRKTIVGLSSAGGGTGGSSPSRKPFPSKSKGQRVKPYVSRHQGGGASGSRSNRNRGSFTDTTDFMDPRTLNPPSSRMSIAWSTTSTRGEDSLPSSPTELDTLAINMVNNITDLSTLMADIIIRDAIQACALPQEIVEHLSITEYDKDSNIPVSKGMTKIDTFLQSLHDAGSRTSLDVSLSMGLVFSPSLYELRKATLRLVATGNWGCGAFKGDPQLKSLLQWMAVSASGRPEMKYFPFNEKRMEQLPRVVEKFQSTNTTVGQLFQLISQYCTTRNSLKNKDLFSFLLDK